MKSLIYFFSGVYIGVGYAIASLIAAAIPALNGWGVLYIVLTWPYQAHCGSVGCDPLPEFIASAVLTFD